MARGVLGVGTRLHHTRAVRHRTEARPGKHRHAGFAVVHARRAVPGWRADAWPGQREHRLPPAPERLFDGCRTHGRALDRTRHRRGRQLRCALHHRFVPAQGSSAAVGPRPSRREERHPRAVDARHGRGLADAGVRAAGAGPASLGRSPDRGAGGLCRPAPAAGTCHVPRGRTFGRGPRAGGRAARGREPGHLAGQHGGAASAVWCHPAGGAGHRPSDRCPFRGDRRGCQFGRWLSATPCVAGSRGSTRCR